MKHFLIIFLNQWLGQEFRAPLSLICTLNIGLKWNLKNNFVPVRFISWLLLFFGKYQLELLIFRRKSILHLSQWEFLPVYLSYFSWINVSKEKKTTPKKPLFLNGMGRFRNLQDKLRLEDSSLSSALCKGASGYIWMPGKLLLHPREQMSLQLALCWACSISENHTTLSWVLFAAWALYNLQIFRISWCPHIWYNVLWLCRYSVVSIAKKSKEETDV